MVLQAGVSLVNQQNKDFDVPHVIANDSNEATHLSSGESTTITATLTNDCYKLYFTYY